MLPAPEGPTAIQLLHVGGIAPRPGNPNTSYPSATIPSFIAKPMPYQHCPLQSFFKKNRPERPVCSFSEGIKKDDPMPYIQARPLTATFSPGSHISGAEQAVQEEDQGNAGHGETPRPVHNTWARQYPKDEKDSGAHIGRLQPPPETAICRILIKGRIQS